MRREEKEKEIITKLLYRINCALLDEVYR